MVVHSCCVVIFDLQTYFVIYFKPKIKEEIYMTFMLFYIMLGP